MEVEDKDETIEIVIISIEVSCAICVVLLQF